MPDSKEVPIWLLGSRYDGGVANSRRLQTLRHVAVALALVAAVCYFVVGTALTPLRNLPVFLVDDPVGDKIGQPSLDPSRQYQRHGSKAMVSSDVPLCSTMGKQILLQGGNAADAAVTVALCIGSVNLHSSGIGGGGFIVSSHGDDVVSIDAREQAPFAAHKHMYDGMPLLAMFGGLAVAVPGELAGLHELHRVHGLGTLLWEQLFEPVVRLNRQGWAAEEIWVRAVHKMHELVLLRVPALNAAWDYIYDDDGQLVQIGSIIRRPNYAATLEQIARNGSAAIFYDPDGPIAPLLANLVSRAWGIVTPADFAAYQPKVSTALKFNFSSGPEEYELFTTGGVLSGLALIAGLNFYTSVNEKHPTEQLVVKTHRLIEAMKWTALARSHLGDLNCSYWGEMVSKYSLSKWSHDTASSLYSDNTTFSWEHYSPLYELTEPKGTSHFSVVDEHGNAVGMTTTVNLLFGSLVYDNETGIVLNDQMDDFSIPDVSNAFNLTPSALNFIVPGHRPLSLTAPTIIKKNGQVEFLIGAAGGSRIVTAILQAIIRTLFENFPLLKTIAFPRLHHQLIPEFAMIENITSFNGEYKHCMLCELEKLGHTFYESGALTAMNGIVKEATSNTNEESQWVGVSDFWRKRGMADGY